MLNLKPGDKLIVKDGITGIRPGTVVTFKDYRHDCRDIWIEESGMSWLPYHFTIAPKEQAPVNTSVAALLQAQPAITSSYDRIMHTLRQRADGYTAVELEKQLGIKAHKRLPELRDAGKVKVQKVNTNPNVIPARWTDVTRVVNGRRSRVWVLPENEYQHTVY